MRTPDFHGWATKCNIKCSDGRTIKPGAFREDDGQVVPLVWQHNHSSPEMVLGHALLEEVPGEGTHRAEHACRPAREAGHVRRA